MTALESFWDAFDTAMEPITTLVEAFDDLDDWADDDEPTSDDWGDLMS